MPPQPFANGSAGPEGSVGEGWSVLLLDTKADNVNHYIVLSILDALRRSHRVSHVDKADYATAIRRAQTTRYDLLLAVDGEAINIDVLGRLKTLVGTSVLWAWEDPYERSRTVGLASLFDLVFTNDSGSVHCYPAGARHLPLAGTDEIPVRASDDSYAYDISFVGSAWPNRVVFLRRLQRALPHLRTRFVLSYNEFLPKAYLDLPESSYVGTVSHYDFLHLANRSRICLTLDRNFCGNGLHARAETPGPRLFEIALAGGYQLVDVACTPVDPFFAPDKEIGTFDRFSACVDKIGLALGDPDRRISLARAAQSRAMAEHRYANRIGTILDALGTRTPRPHIIDRAAQPAMHKIRPKVLFVTHNTVAGGNFGGVEVYQETIADGLRSDFDVLYYRPAQPAVRDGQREFVLTDGRHNIIATYATPDFDAANTLSQPEAEAAFARVLSEHAIELVHFQHLINHCASLPVIARILGLPVLGNLHDFWVVCTRFTLLDNRGEYCRIAERPKVACDMCLTAASGIVAGAQDYRRRFFAGVLGAFDRIIGGSSSAIAIARGVYPDLPADIFVALGIPVPRAAPVVARPAVPEPKPASAPLRVVFLGNFTNMKGADTFLAAARTLRHDTIAFTICGRIDRPYETMLTQAGLPNVTVEGAFDPGELDLKRFDVSLHLSIWPETYCITLSEAWMAGLVPIVAACGALAERVTDGQDGYHVPVNGAAELVAVLRRLDGNRRELDGTRANISPLLWLTSEQHCVTLRDIYRELIASFRLPARLALPKVDTGTPTDFTLHGQRLTPRNWTRPDDLPLPSPLERCAPPLAPLWRQNKRVEAALDGGRLDIGSALQWHLDAIGTLNDPYRPDGQADRISIIVKALPQAPLQLFGWLRPSTSVPSNLMLAVRSVAKDLILRPAYLHYRADLQNGAGADSIGLGFVTDPFPLLMLDEGVYGMELVSLQAGVLEIVPVAAILVSAAGVACLTAPGQTVVRVPLPGAAWQDLAPHRPEGLIGVLDDIEITPARQDDAASPQILLLSGWAFVAHAGESCSAAALQFSGEFVFHVALTQGERTDVVQTLNVGAIRSPGYEGAISLCDLPDDTYTLELIKRVPNGTASRRLGRLCIEAAGRRARIERFEEATELRTLPGHAEREHGLAAA